ncbi:MAG: hypothetical protein AB8B69_09985, partial [Chitinophagales bacterium]
MQTPKLITTTDGSHSLYVPELNETYHSKHGAIQESNHIFIEAGLKDLQRKESLTNPLHILEIGFGTGLNAFLTRLAASNFAVNYSSLEAYPLSKEITSALNYPDILAVSEADKKIFEVMHECAWNEVIEVRPNFHLTKLHQKL